MKLLKLLILCVAILESCSPKVKSTLVQEGLAPLTDEVEVIILQEEDIVPEGSILVGDLKVGDSGFSTDCGYDIVMRRARQKARESGANLIHLTQIKKPNLGSTCYRIKAKMYKNEDAAALANLDAAIEIKNESRLPKTADYAMVYFYRPKNFYGSLIGYKVRHNDKTIIGRVRNGEKFAYKITDFGEHTFWGKTESETSVVINIEPAQEYFIRCSITMGAAVGRPEMYVVDNYLGVVEYEEMEEKK